jgi:hypothetical protein
VILLRSKVLWRLHQYWDGRRGPGRWMPKQAIDPAELVDILPHLFMLDAIGVPPRFRVRLVGTSVVRLVGRDNTGRYVEDFVESEKQAAALGPYRAVIDRERPIAKRGALVWLDNRRWIKTEALLLPVSRSGAAIDLVLGATIEIEREARLRSVAASRSVEYDQAQWGPDFAFASEAVSLPAAAQ